MKKSLVAAIVLNWNDAEFLPYSVGSLLKQSESADIIIVDNGSTDGSKKVIEAFGAKVTPLWNTDNLGFAGGVNTGIRYAIEQGYKYVALLNNDAVADKDWVKELISSIEKNDRTGAATSTMLHKRDNTYDSTGDFYTIWGLPYPRGRDEEVLGQYNKHLDIMSASGGASMFRTSMLKQIGLFDEDFFAYYEDSDLGLRANLSGWKFVFAPKASVLHATGSTSGRVKNFATYQTLKNLPLVLIKNVPLSLMHRILPRFVLAHSLFTLRAISRGQVTTVLKSWFILLWLIPKKLAERVSIQRGATEAGKSQLKKVLVYDLPGNATALRKFRSLVRKVFPKFV